MGCAASIVREPWKNFSKHPELRHHQKHQRLGAGAFSEVWRATSTESKEPVALKVVFWKNPKLKPHHVQILQSEAVLLRELQHPHLVHCYGATDDERCLILVLELLSGGELLEHLHEIEHYTEAQAAYLFRQVTSAVEYLHSQNVLHRDIKPENIVFVDSIDSYRRKGQKPLVKLIDLGLARRYSSSRSIKARLGSPGFMSPETIDGKRHTPAMDMYSLGVLLFVMLTGSKPMHTEQARKLSYAALEATEYPKMKSNAWKRLSALGKSLVIGLLERDPAKRLTAKQVMAHEWIMTQGGSKPVQLGRDVTDRATKLATQRRFKGLAHAVIALNRFGTLNANSERSLFKSIIDGQLGSPSLTIGTRSGSFRVDTECDSNVTKGTEEARVTGSPLGRTRKVSLALDCVRLDDETIEDVAAGPAQRASPALRLPATNSGGEMCVPPVGTAAADRPQPLPVSAALLFKSDKQAVPPLESGGASVQIPAGHIAP